MGSTTPVSAAPPKSSHSPGRRPNTTALLAVVNGALLWVLQRPPHNTLRPSDAGRRRRRGHPGRACLARALIPRPGMMQESSHRASRSGLPQGLCIRSELADIIVSWRKPSK